MPVRVEIEKDWLWKREIPIDANIRTESKMHYGLDAISTIQALTFLPWDAIVEKVTEILDQQGQ